METLYIYADGYDLEEVANLLEERFAEFVERWRVPHAEVVNHRTEEITDLLSGDLPEWNLGLNIALGILSRNKVEELVAFLAELSRETQREFVIGHFDSKTMIASDWFGIGAEPSESQIEMLVEQLK